MVELTNGVLFGFPSDFGQGLHGPSAAGFAATEIDAGGYGVHREALDVDRIVPGLVAGIFGSSAWMRELGRPGGSATSEAKRRAARINGRKGGRLRKNAARREGDSGG